MKGVYLVFFSLKQGRDIEIGALGDIEFEQGIYVYAGSGRTSVKKRIQRHFSQEVNKFWHIDYFSEVAEPVDYFILPEKSDYECFMASELEEMAEPVEDFGSSDCDCRSHLFRITSPESF